jgi:CheY-like chemotaxis protein
MSPTLQTASRSSNSMSTQRLARVLIVEDDELSLDIATRWMKRHGYANVEGTMDGAGGLQACLQDRPDIIFLDHALPIVSGLAIAEHMSINYRREERPWIVLFTAAADSTITRLMSTGYFDDLLRKPCASVDYFNALDRGHIGLSERRRRVDSAWRTGTSGPRLVRSH